MPPLRISLWHTHTASALPFPNWMDAASPRAPQPATIFVPQSPSPAAASADGPEAPRVAARSFRTSAEIPDRPSQLATASGRAGGGRSGARRGCQPGRLGSAQAARWQSTVNCPRRLSQRLYGSRIGSNTSLLVKNGFLGVSEVRESGASAVKHPGACAPPVQRRVSLPCFSASFNNATAGTGARRNGGTQFQVRTGPLDR